MPVPSAKHPTDFLELLREADVFPFVYESVLPSDVASGVDFLGWVHFPDHRVLRTATKKRMFRKLDEGNVSSYLGLLGVGNGYTLKRKLSEKMAKE